MANELEALRQTKTIQLTSRKLSDAGDAILLEVVLDEAMEERDLEADEALVGGQRHRPHRRAHVGVSRLLQLLLHVDPLQDLERLGVDDLEPALVAGPAMAAAATTE